MVLKIGLIGLDTSHVEIFAKILSKNHKEHLAGVRVVIGYPSPSLDIELSKNRVGNYTERLKEDYDVKIAKSILEVVEASDALFITALDGRKHLDLFKEIVSYGKPVFIDKPFTVTSEEAEEIFALSTEYQTPVMSSSALRFADSLVTHLANEQSKVMGVYLNGPMPFIEKIPYYSWYGIHMIETLFTILGSDFQDINIHSNKDYDVITVEFKDGRFGVIRGSRVWHSKFEVMIHYTNKTIHLPLYKDEKSYYVSLLEEIITFCKTGKSPISNKETVAIMKFIDVANKLKASQCE